MDAEAHSPRPVEITREQQYLLEVFRDRDYRYGCRLEEMYIGALQVLTQTNNPQRLQHAAHSVREILDKLPYYYDGAPARTWGTEASRHLSSIGQYIGRAKDQSSCYNPADSTWIGQIDEVLIFSLQEIDKTLAAQATKLTKAEANRQLFRSLDPLEQPLPPDKEEELLRDWGKSNQFFQNVAHHNIYSSDEEFRMQFDTFTRLLLSQLRPTTSETIDAIDKIIAEAEENA